MNTFTLDRSEMSHMIITVFKLLFVLFRIVPTEHKYFDVLFSLRTVIWSYGVDSKLIASRLGSDEWDIRMSALGPSWHVKIISPLHAKV